MYRCGVFQRFFDEGLAQASFLVGCERTREAVVIDPGHTPEHIAILAEGPDAPSRLFAGEGVPKVVSVTGGMAAYRAVGAT